MNNLLSRDDDEGEDGEDGQDSYVPEDLISLLDGGIHGDHSSVIIDADSMFSEDMFNYSSMRARSGAPVGLGQSRRPAGERSGAVAADRDLSDRDRDSFSRWRDRQYFGPGRRWLESALRDSGWTEKDTSESCEMPACFILSLACSVVTCIDTWA